MTERKRYVISNDVAKILNLKKEDSEIFRGHIMVPCEDGSDYYLGYVFGKMLDRMMDLEKRLDEVKK